MFKIKVFEIPEAPRTSRGRNIVNLVNLQSHERVCGFMPISDFEKEECYLLFATAQGLVERTALKDYRNVNRSGLIAVNLRDGDELIGVTWTSGEDHIILGTRKGMAIRFSETDARVMGRNASGVKGIGLGEDDRVVGLVRIAPGEEADLLTATQKGYGKRTPTTDYLVQSEDGSTRTQGRGGKGRRDIAVNKRNGDVVTLLCIHEDDDLMLITLKGMIVRISAAPVRRTSRGTQGVRLINLSEEDRLVAVARVVEKENGENGSETNGSDASGNPANAGQADGGDGGDGGDDNASAGEADTDTTPDTNS